MTAPDAKPNPARSQYRDELEKLGVKLPLNHSTQNVGVVFDTDGKPVFTVDQERERPDEEVYQICTWIVTAVNTCSGFIAVRTETPS